MTQGQLAALLNLKPSAISKYEKGHTQPSLQTLVRMADIFSCSVDYLLGLTDLRNPYGPAPFTPTEAELITRYRRLSREDQIRIRERISTLLEMGPRPR